MTDSNPLVSLLAKVLAGLRGAPLNLLGFWFASCWLLQPLAAVYCLRGFGCRSWPASVAAAIFAVSFPALLFRVGHVNLCGQFLLLFALGMALRMLDAGRCPLRRWYAAAGLLSVAVLCQPYLYVFAAAAFAAPALQSILDRRPDARRWIGCYLGAVVTPIALYALLSGTLGGGERGFGFYSMNLLSPVWPQRSGLFGAALPVIDATGGQYEGFNYLGAGALLLLGLAVALLVRQRAVDWRRWRALIVILTMLTVLALSSRIFFGKLLIYPDSLRSRKSSCQVA